jgi:hypothetical protein
MGEFRFQAIRVLLGLALVRGVIYAAIIPPWQAPDEPGHFNHALTLHELGRAVSPNDRSDQRDNIILASMDRFHFWDYLPWAQREDPGSQLHQPGLYYRLVAAPLLVFDSADPAQQLLVMRPVSVLLNIATVLLAAISAWLLFPDDIFMQIGIPSFVAFLPMNTFMGSVLNNDNLVKFTVSLTFLCIAWALRSGLSLFNLTGLVGSMVLGYFAKRAFVFAIPATLLVLPLALWLRPPRRTLARLGVSAGVLALVATGIVAWQSGWPVSRLPSLLAQLTYSSTLPDPTLILQQLRGVWFDYIRFLFISFWAAFGWVTIEVHPLWYVLLLAICGVAVVGLGRLVSQAIRHQAALTGWQWATLTLYGLSSIILIILALATFSFYETGPVTWFPKGHLPQGRYLLPAIIPIATLFTLGLRAWLPDTPRTQRRALLAFIVGFFALDAIWLVGRLIPAFYGG